MTTRRAVIAIAGAMAGSAVIGQVGRPTIRIADSADRIELDTYFPGQFEGWKVDNSLPVIVPAPDVQATLNKIYNQVLARTYVDASGYRVMMSVAYGGDKGGGGMSIHRPEICYPAQGFRISASKIEPARFEGREFDVRRLSTYLGNRREPVTYWVIVGDRVVASGMEQKVVEMRYGLRNLIPDGMLVRVSSIDPDPEHAWKYHDEFLRRLFHGMDPKRLDRVLGPVNQRAA